MRLSGQLFLAGLLFVSLHAVAAQSDATSVVNASTATANLSLSPDANASALLSSPMAGLMPELTPSEETEGILLFLLQVSGPAANFGNANLNWALSVNLATRLDYVTIDNLYLLNYTQLPTNPPAGQRRRLLQTATPTPTPAIGEISNGVVSLPDLGQETANLSTVGTGVITSTPSMAFMYEADVGSADYISYVHNQLNSIIATSALLRDVRSANLSINSIYLVSFEPAYEPNATSTNITSYSSPGKGSHRKLSIVLISTLVPVALVLGAVTGSLAFWHKSRRKAARQGFAPQASSNGMDSMQGSKALNKHMGSKELSGLTSANSSTSFTALSVNGSQTPLASDAPKPDGAAMPPAWINDIPFSDWEIAADDVAICLRPDGRKWELGAGAFSKVYRGLLRSVQVVAIKVFNDGPQYGADSDEDRLQTLSALKRQREVLIRQEIAVLKSCRDRNIVQFVGACIRREQTMLITEYMEGGDLYHAIASDNTGRFSWYRTLPDGRRTPGLGRRIALDVARGLHFLHSRRLVHFDLKSANILLARDHTAKIADVGLAKIMHRQFLSTLYNVGTFAWSAPEVLLGKSTCTEMVDIYSYGVVLWEICAGEAPPGRQLRPLRAPEDCPQAAADLVLRCTDENPEARPTARQIVECLAQLREPTQ